MINKFLCIAMLTLSLQFLSHSNIGVIAAENPCLAKLPRFAHGAVYFRKTNAPEEDWERDYQTAAQDGHNLFRH